MNADHDCLESSPHDVCLDTALPAAPTLPPPPGRDFTGAKIANHRPGARVRTWTGELGEVINLGGERRGMCPLEHRMYRVRLDGETVVHEWRAWMLTAEGK